ncbi:hypothetical protein ACS77_02210 [Pseudomonas syringae]|uniref:TnsA endonuclease N-terminal domain-containing protein n=1 Tax=Pseudomonas syringae TaxID=317 RepID=A0A0L1MMP9_PSESX|nr:hypothetical protein ACS77_02210 [Pseudomonas syringae]
MARLTQTPSSSLIAKMRSRRPAISYLWSCYSFKTDTDLILESHQELIHWLLFLEFNREIKSFWIPGKDEFYSDQLGGRKVKPDAIAINRLGQQEWHEVKPDLVDKESFSSSQLRVEQQIAHANNAIFRLFDNGDRISHMFKVPALMRLTCFVALCRYLDHASAMEEQIADFIKQEQHGTVQQLFHKFSYYEPVYIFGILSRLFIVGDVSIELDEQTPCLSSRWTYEEE